MNDSVRKFLSENGRKGGKSVSPEAAKKRAKKAGKASGVARRKLLRAQKKQKKGLHDLTS